VADVGEEKSLVDGDVGGILVGGGIGGALIGVPFPTHVGITTLLLVVLLLFLLLSSLVVAPVTVTRNRTFCYKVTGLTTLVAHLLGTGFVVSPLSLLETNQVVAKNDPYMSNLNQNNFEFLFELILHLFYLLYVVLA
jgi:hypothetical protein